MGFTEMREHPPSSRQTRPLPDPRPPDGVFPVSALRVVVEGGERKRPPGRRLEAGGDGPGRPEGLR